MITLLVGIVAGIFALFGVKKAGDAVAGAFKPSPEKKMATEIVENRAVAQKEETAKTPEDVYAALEADRKSDHT